MRLFAAVLVIIVLLIENPGAFTLAQVEADEDLHTTTCTEASETSPLTCASNNDQEIESQTSPPHYYTAHDDVSWAITKQELRYPYHQRLYAEFLAQCRKASRFCKSQEDLRLHMNKHQPSSVYNYTKTGFVKMKAPPPLWKIVNDFYQKNKDKAVVEWGTSINPYHNLWDVQTQIIRLDNVTLGGGPDLHSLISRVTRPIVEQWTGQRLAPVSVYGVRIYPNRSILAPHVDRMPLVSSVIINLDQEVGEPWPLEVYGHNGIAANVTMEPGDMVLYESHSVIQ